MDIKKMIISQEATILEAMQAIDDNSRKQLFVVKDEKLMAAISDGDIRRWLLRGGSLEDKVCRAANYHPQTVTEQEAGMAWELMVKKEVDVIPVIDESGRIRDVICRKDTASEHSPVFKENVPVVIMAGGLGTRLYPYTKILPKPLIPIGDIPITEHIMNRFRRFGCRDFYLTVNHKKNMIKAYYNEIEKDYNIYFVEEERPLGTGGGVRLLKERLASTFILTNCDTLIEVDYTKIVAEHRKKGNAVTMICSLKNFDIPYGVVEIGENGSIAAMREKPHYSFFTNTGTYIVEPKIMDDIGENEEIGFPDVIRRVKEAGQNAGVYPVNEKAWLDMGQFDSMEEMKERLGVGV